jgi:pyruvate ferredoxin oxidoreductase gamma subunit
MNDLIEIRWHGRGGQGVKTIALLFGEAILKQGKFTQAFPEYGPERRGAPVQAFNRISTQPINIHCQVSEPDIVVVLDPTLLHSPEVTRGLEKAKKMLINTTQSVNEVRRNLPEQPQALYVLDASQIARETLGQDIPNTPLMGGLAKISHLIDLKELLAEVKNQLEEKFRSKKSLIEKNLEAIRRGYQEVSSE